MERITMQQVTDRAALVNNGLRNRQPNTVVLGEHWFVQVERRYGYLGIDLYRGTSCINTLSTGLSKRQAYDYLGAMLAMADIEYRIENVA